MSPALENLFPLVQVRKLVSELSDHSPLLLISGDSNTTLLKNREFKFDIAWFKQDDFLDTVTKIWSKPVRSVDPIDILNIQLKRFKKHF
jgi:hypothetical protein